MTVGIGKVYYLSKVGFFSELNTAELRELAGDFQWEDYEEGADIIRQGQEEHSFYVLIEGNAETVVTEETHNLWRGAAFGPGDAFGEISLFTGKAAPSTVRCLEKCRVLSLDAEHFALMLLRLPKLYPKFIEELSHSLNKLNYDLWEARHKELLLSALQLNQFEDKFYGIWGSVRTTSEVEKKLAELAQTKEHFLVIGERGTGRQMMAWYAHKRRFGETAPFVVVDGRNFDQQWGDLMLEDREVMNLPVFKNSSLIDIVQDGTLFIREINLISPLAQRKLAHYLQQKKSRVFVVGSLQDEPEKLQQKLIPELSECFNQRYAITPLRERKRDIPVIALGILEKLAQKHNREKTVLDIEANKLLLSHNYRQGNVTELIQVIERAFFLAENNVIGLEHIFFGPTAEKIGRSINLLSWQKIDRLFKKGNFVKWLQRLTVAVFLAIILLLMLAPNTGIAVKVFILVWGLWWPALAIVSPFLGRLWCTVCPFSFIMDNVQKRFHLNRPVPDILKKYDYLFVTFLFLFIFWIEIITGMRHHPGYTVMLLISIQLAAIVTGIIFSRHTWCSHLCPLGGFVGLASIGAMLEIRADAEVCLNKCTTHECYVGKGNVSGCPMSQHLPYVDNNLACKLCFNCVRNCPNGAVQFNLRVPAREVWHLVRVNQGFAIFTGVVLAMLVPINYFEPFQSGLSQEWKLWFSLFYWGAALTAGILTWLVARPFKTKAASRRIKLVFAFIPLILGGHIIYQIHFIPGASSLMLGFGFKGSVGIMNTVFVPALTLGQAAAALIGIALASFSSLMVLYHHKLKQIGAKK